MSKIWLVLVCCLTLIYKHNYNSLIDGACGSFPCVHGTCTSNSTLGPGYNCSCQSGWTGQQCETGTVLVINNCTCIYKTKNVYIKLLLTQSQ